MKTLLNPWFVAACLLWLLIYITRHVGMPLPYYANNYLTDALAVPVVGNLGLWFQRNMVIRNNYYVLSPWHVVFIVIMLSIWFEVLLPQYSGAYIADSGDILLYILGGVFFYKVMNKPVND